LAPWRLIGLPLDGGPSENQARGGPAPPRSVGARVAVISRGKGRRPPRGVASRCQFSWTLFNDQSNRGERTGRDPSRDRTQGRGPYVLSTRLCMTLDGQDRTGHPGPDGTHSALFHPRPPATPSSLWRLVRKIATPKPAPTARGRRKGRGRAGKTLGSSGRGEESRGATSPCLLSPAGPVGRGCRSRALTLSAPRAAGLMASTIQQFSPSPIRNNGTTYFLRKAGLSGPT
jgi:hypothetical protein